MFLLWIGLPLVLQASNCRVEGVTEPTWDTTPMDISSDRCPPGPMHYCPSFCDSKGLFRSGQCCKNPPYCCMDADSQLTCCYNKNQSIGTDVTDHYNCEDVSTDSGWKILVGMGIGVSMVAFTGTALVCTYQSVKTRSRQPSRRQRRTTTLSECSTCENFELGVVNPASSDSFLDPELLDVLQPPPYTADTPPPYEP